MGYELKARFPFNNNASIIIKGKLVSARLLKFCKHLILMLTEFFVEETLMIFLWSFTKVVKVFTIPSSSLYEYSIYIIPQR